jgi:hypothetical protein
VSVTPFPSSFLFLVFELDECKTKFYEVKSSNNFFDEKKLLGMYALMIKRLAGKEEYYE